MLSEEGIKLRIKVLERILDNQAKMLDLGYEDNSMRIYDIESQLYALHYVLGVQYKYKWR